MGIISNIIGGVTQSGLNARQKINYLIDLYNKIAVSDGSFNLLRIDPSFIKKATPTGDFLKDDGTWDSALSTPLGKIRIVDLAGTHFTNLATANAYVVSMNLTPSDEGYFAIGGGGVYYFTVPPNSYVTGSSSFLGGSTAYIQDPLGLINGFMDIFSNNSGKGHILGEDVYFLEGDFNSFSGTIRIKSILFILLGGPSPTAPFADSSTGTFIIEGISPTNPGTNGLFGFGNGSFYGSLFFQNSTATIQVPASQYTCNAGGIQGDLQNAIANGANVQFEGINLEKVSNKQNSLTVDGTGILYPTVDAVNAGNTAILNSATTYADSLVVGLLDDRGNYNPSTNANQYPTSGGSGTLGAILKGDLWSINGLGVGVSALIGAKTVTDGDVIRALVNSPGQVDANYVITENNFGYTAENTANKSNSLTDIASTSKFPVWAILVSYITSLGYQVALTAANFGAFINGLSSKTTPIDADSISIVDSAASNVQKKVSLTNLWTNYFKPKNDLIYQTKKFTYCDGTIGTVSSSNSLTISQYVLIPAGTFNPASNQAIRIQVKARKSGSTSYGFLYIGINTTLNVSGMQTLGGIHSSGNNTYAYLGYDRAIPIQIGAFDSYSLVNQTSGDDNVIAPTYNSITIDWTVDQYIMNVPKCNNGTDNMWGSYLMVTQE